MHPQGFPPMLCLSAASPHGRDAWEHLMVGAPPTRDGSIIMVSQRLIWAPQEPL